MMRSLVHPPHGILQENPQTDSPHVGTDISRPGLAEQAIVALAAKSNLSQLTTTKIQDNAAYAPYQSSAPKPNTAARSCSEIIDRTPPSYNSIWCNLWSLIPQRSSCWPAPLTGDKNLKNSASEETVGLIGWSYW